MLDGKIAPGTSGTFDIELDTRGTEVAMLYDVTIGMSNCPRNITFSKKGPGENSFTVISPMQTGDETTRSRTINFSKYLTLNDVTTANTNDTKFVETIKWDWPYELTGNDPATNQPYTTEQKTAYDLRDNADQGQTVTINITAVGTEVMNTPLTTATISYEEQDSLRNGDTISAYKGETTQININNNTENVTFSSSDPSVVKIDADGKVTGIEEGEAIITITGQETGKVVSLNVKTKLAIRATINGESKLLSEDNTGLYYGSVVSDYKVNNEDYQLLFIDWKGKFGNKGDIYLKKKEDVPINGCSLSTKTDYSLPEMLIDEMNPSWKMYDGVINQDTEKAATWLCDTSVWSEYAVGDYARYAIGGPSIEMYVDSHQEAVEANESNQGNPFRYYFSTNPSGYRKNGQTRIPGKNNMYSLGKHWLGSPAAPFNYTNRLYRKASTYIYDDPYTLTGENSNVAPVVCLMPDFPLQLEY